MPLIDEKGNVFGVLGICYNVTQQKLIEQNTYNLNLKLEKECDSKSDLIESLNQIISSPLNHVFQNDSPPFDEKSSKEQIYNHALLVWKSAYTLIDSLKEIMKKNA